MTTKNEVIMEGYLKKQSAHLKQLRKRWMVLKGQYLYSFKTKETVKDPTETFNLSLFSDVVASSNSTSTQFELVSSKQRRVFVAESAQEMNNWITCIKQCINKIQYDLDLDGINNCVNINVKTVQKISVSDNEASFSSEIAAYQAAVYGNHQLNYKKQNTYSPIINNDNNHLSTYESLVSMGYDHQLALMAARTFPYNISDAVNYIEQKKKEKDWNGESNDKIKVTVEENMPEIKLGETNQTIDESDDEGGFCKSIRTCVRLKRLINTLKIYQEYNNTNDNDKLSEYINENKQYFINDYHHILDEHLNEDNSYKTEVNEEFKIIYKIINEHHKLNCDIKTCKIYLRNNRQRETTYVMNENNDKQLAAGMDILDSIHQYFLHSVDTGYRIVNSILDDDDKNNNDDISYDKELSQLKSHLQKTKENIQKIREGRFDNNKFMSDMISIEKKITKGQYDEKSEPVMQQKDRQYYFGQRHDYWNKDKSAKYASIKLELLNNTILCVELDTFEAVLEKGKYLLKNSNKIKSMHSNIDNYNFVGSNNELLNIGNILAVILYTDYDTLCNEFRSTFRKLTYDETFEEIQQRNKELFHWSKMLIETVNTYGISLDQSSINALYHGVDLVYFSSFLAEFNAPTSMTTQLQIATLFTRNNGIILELQRYDQDFWSSKLRYFNCSFISCFANENERLFIQPPLASVCYLKFVSIRNMVTNENYKDFIDAITKFEQVIDKNDFNYLSNELDNSWVNVMKNLFSILLPSDTNIAIQPHYVLKAFKKWTNSKTYIKINMKELSKYYSDTVLMHRNVKGLLAFDNINLLFQNIQSITIELTGKIDKNYMNELLSMLISIENLKFSKLFEINFHHIENMDNMLLLQGTFHTLFEAQSWEIKIGEYSNENDKCSVSSCSIYIKRMNDQ